RAPGRRRPPGSRGRTVDRARSPLRGPGRVRPRDRRGRGRRHRPGGRARGPRDRRDGTVSMRYAVVSDVHGETSRLREVVEQIHRTDVDRVLSLGDLFECRIGKARVAAFEYRTAAEVFDADPAIAELLDGALLLRGNQEERIVSLVPGPDLPEW